MKSEKRKKISFSIIFMVCLVASSSFSIPQADFSLPTIAIISDSQDKLVQKTAQSIYTTIIGFGFPRVNYITASDIEDVVTILSQNNYITILVFHGDKEGIKIGRERESWEEIGQILDANDQSNIILETRNIKNLKLENGGLYIRSALPWSASLGDSKTTEG